MHGCNKWIKGKAIRKEGIAVGVVVGYSKMKRHNQVEGKFKSKRWDRYFYMKKCLSFDGGLQMLLSEELIQKKNFSGPVNYYYFGHHAKATHCIGWITLFLTYGFCHIHYT